jgi:hypothetical protein
MHIFLIFPFFSNSLILRAMALTSFGLNYFLAKLKGVWSLHV